MTFTLSIELGHDVQTYEDIADALLRTAARLFGTIEGGDGNAVRDIHGNRVGVWSIVNRSTKNAIAIRELNRNGIGTDTVFVYRGNDGLGTLEFDDAGNIYWTDAISAKTTKIGEGPAE